MAQAAVLYRDYDLPWTSGAEQERRFRRLLAVCVVGLLGVALLLSVLPAPQKDPAVIDEIPPRLARLVLERVEPPPPPLQREEAEREPVAEPTIEERRVETEQVMTGPRPEPAPLPAPEERKEQARERARGVGLLPFAEQLSALRNNTALTRLDSAPTAAGATTESAAVEPERSLISARTGRSSGGIDTAVLSRDTGGAGLVGRETTQVESRLAETTSGAADSVSDASGPARSREEIERVFDRNKGAIYALYNRALRQNPTLAGKLVLQLTIAPDGRVTSCEVVSSELGDAELERRLVQRVLLFEFEPKDVEPITTTKPIDFFPA